MEMEYFPIARVNEVGHRRKEPKDPNEQGEKGIIFVENLRDAFLSKKCSFF